MTICGVFPFFLMTGLLGVCLAGRKESRLLLSLVVFAGLWALCWGLSELLLMLRTSVDGQVQAWNDTCGMVQKLYLSPMLETFPWVFGMFAVLVLILGPLTGKWRSVPVRRGAGCCLMILTLVGAVLTDFWCLPLRLTTAGPQERWAYATDGAEVYRSTIATWVLLDTGITVTARRDIPIYEYPDTASAQLDDVSADTEYTLSQMALTVPTTQSGWRYCDCSGGFVRTADLLRGFPGNLVRYWLLMEDWAAMEEGRFVSPDLWRLYAPVNTVASAAILVMLWICNRRKRQWPVRRNTDTQDTTAVS